MATKTKPTKPKLTPSAGKTTLVKEQRHAAVVLAQEVNKLRRHVAYLRTTDECGYIACKESAEAAQVRLRGLTLALNLVRTAARQTEQRDRQLALADPDRKLTLDTAEGLMSDAASAATLELEQRVTRLLGPQVAQHLDLDSLVTEALEYGDLGHALLGELQDAQSLAREAKAAASVAQSAPPTKRRR